MNREKTINFFVVNVEKIKYVNTYIYYAFVMNQNILIQFFLCLEN